jgi:hypothetical protein
MTGAGGGVVEGANHLAGRFIKNGVWVLNKQPAPRDTFVNTLISA